MSRQPKPMPLQAFYSIDEFAHLLGHSYWFVYSAVKNHEIKATRMQRGSRTAILIPRSELDRLISEAC